MRVYAYTWMLTWERARVHACVCVHVIKITYFLQADAGLHAAHVVPLDVDQVGGNLSNLDVCLHSPRKQRRLLDIFTTSNHKTMPPICKPALFYIWSTYYDVISSAVPPFQFGCIHITHRLTHLQMHIYIPTHALEPCNIWLTTNKPW